MGEVQVRLMAIEMVCVSQANMVSIFFFFLVRKSGPELTSVATLPLFAGGRLSLS